MAKGLLLVVALALLVAGAAAVSCRTNGASPTQGDANSCVQYIRNLGSSECGQTNCGGDRCTVMCRAGGAQVKICGDCNRGTRCSNAGDALNNILAQCVSNVGGTPRVAGTEDAHGFTFVIEGNRGRTLSKYDVHCRTNGEAPSQGDADRVVQHLRKHGEEKCKQTTCDGDQCTVLHRDGDAQAKICGGKCNDGPKCIVAGDALNEVLARCVKDVNGKVRVAGESEAEGYRFVLEKVRSHVTCTTDNHGVRLDEANDVIEHLRSLGNTECKQNNCNGDKCTTVHQNGNARVRLCGNCNKSIKCGKAGDALLEMVPKCTKCDDGMPVVSGKTEVEGFTVELEGARKNILMRGE